MKTAKKIVLILIVIMLLLPGISFARRTRSSLDTPEIRALLPIIVEAITSQDKEKISTLVSGNSTLSSKKYWSSLLNNLNKDSWKAETYSMLAITSKRIGEHRDAVEYYKQAAEEFKILGMIANAGARLEQASIVLKQQLFRYDESIDVRIESAECFREAGNYLEAGRMYASAIDITLNNTTKYDNDSQWLFDTYLACAQCFKDGGDFKTAAGKYDSVGYYAAQKLYDNKLSVLYNVKSAECAQAAAEQFLTKDRLQDALFMFKSAVKRYAFAATLSGSELDDFVLYSNLAAEISSRIAELYNQMGETTLEKKAWGETANLYLTIMRAHIVLNNKSLLENFRIKAALALENANMFEEAQKLFR